MIRKAHTTNLKLLLKQRRQLYTFVIKEIVLFQCFVTVLLVKQGGLHSVMLCKQLE